MRIITGKFKNQYIYIPQKIHFRPTSNKVKESIFSSLGEKIIDSNFLDLFSGSGNIGIEALSRGAKQVFFIDNNLKSINLIKYNLKSFKISDKYFKIIKNDFKKALKFLNNQNIKFDIIYADPPYEKNFLKIVLKYLDNYNILSNSGIFLLEQSKREKFNETLINLELFKILEYGDTIVSFYKRKL